MKVSSTLRNAAGSLVLALALCATAHATDILNITTSLTLADPTQLGRLSRNAIQQDWANSEPFPGVINPTTTYHYHTFTIDPFTASLGPFMQISLDDQGASQGNLFVSAYFTSYVPNSVATGNLGFDTHWLGDAGSSGNFFGGTDPAFFNVIVPTGMSLVVVVANAGAANLGVGEQFNLLVESFSSVDYDPARTGQVGSVPDAGSTALLVGLGLIGLVFARRSLLKPGTI